MKDKDREHDSPEDRKMDKILGIKEDSKRDVELDRKMAKVFSKKRKM